MNTRWQKSSYCSEGASCVHIAAGRATIHITESADPTQAILTTAPSSFTALIHTLKEEKSPRV
ncbi:DUF397 domain-containing protein [Streptomyces sp. CA-210063]|uniref:DUF397 domain-containing protein n=1 Tax=Streptomyces sp. CA-210063 TaxID=2801029 RepID=UPI00214C32F3|nr:DUF397 domain-containing protein [Streptomyces sp. CA-210063]UUU32863.1 DUF397 domain-containing protein [Streptomyces sp. CA-210063]